MWLFTFVDGNKTSTTTKDVVEAFKSILYAAARTPRDRPVNAASTGVSKTWLEPMDLANALRRDSAILYMGATWFIPIFLVPVLLVTHFMAFVRLIKHVNSQKL